MNQSCNNKFKIKLNKEMDCLINYYTMIKLICLYASRKRYILRGRTSKIKICLIKLNNQVKVCFGYDEFSRHISQQCELNLNTFYLGC